MKNGCVKKLNEVTVTTTGILPGVGPAGWPPVEPHHAPATHDPAFRPSLFSNDGSGNVLPLPIARCTGSLYFCGGGVLPVSYGSNGQRWRGSLELGLFEVRCMAEQRIRVIESRIDDWIKVMTQSVVSVDRGHVRYMSAECQGCWLALERLEIQLEGK